MSKVLISNWIKGSLAPDFIVGAPDDPQLLRWYIIPRNPWFGMYLHKFVRSDEDRALHDHPKDNLSIILTRGYLEHFSDKIVVRRRWQIITRKAETAHRIQLFDTRPCWSLFLTGRQRREWGFHCPQGWRHWKEFVDVYSGGNSTGKGCE